MGKMGEGDFFSPQLLAEAVRKTRALTESYNDMAAHINELIETNYISSITRKFQAPGVGGPAESPFSL